MVYLHAGVADRRMWREQLSQAASSHCAVAYDRRGFGETTYQSEPHTEVDDLLAVLDAVGGEGPAILVGCSQGARIALEAALAHPERIAALVLISPAVGGAPQPDHPSEVAAIIAAVDAAEDAGDIERVNALEAHLWLDGPLSPIGRVTGPARDLFLKMNGIALRAPAPGAIPAQNDAYFRLDSVLIPVLSIWGHLDFPHLESRCHHLASSLPNGEALGLSGVAHLPSLEAPSETRDVLGAFLSRL